MGFGELGFSNLGFSEVGGPRLLMLPVTHQLRDLAGEIIKGRFYEPEVQQRALRHLPHIEDEETRRQDTVPHVVQRLPERV